MSNFLNDIADYIKEKGYNVYSIAVIENAGEAQSIQLQNANACRTIPPSRLQAAHLPLHKGGSGVVQNRNTPVKPDLLFRLVCIFTQYKLQEQPQQSKLLWL